MPKGGKQPGAGRPKGSVSKSTREALELKARLVVKYHERADEIFGALVGKAIEGDVPAIRELNDRVFGKASQAVDLTSGNKPFTLIFGDAHNNLEQDEQAD